MAIGTTMTKRKRSVHYVNNKEFLEALIDYRQRVVIAEQRGDPKPQNPKTPKPRINERNKLSNKLIIWTTNDKSN